MRQPCQPERRRRQRNARQAADDRIGDARAIADTERGAFHWLPVDAEGIAEADVLGAAHVVAALRTECAFAQFHVLRLETDREGQLIIDLVGDVRVHVDRHHTRTVGDTGSCEKGVGAIGGRQAERRIHVEAENEVLVDAVGRVGGRNHDTDADIAVALRRERTKRIGRDADERQDRGQVTFIIPLADFAESGRVPEGRRERATGSRTGVSRTEGIGALLVDGETACRSARHREHRCRNGETQGSKIGANECAGLHRFPPRVD